VQIFEAGSKTILKSKREKKGRRRGREKKKKKKKKKRWISRETRSTRLRRQLAIEPGGRAKKAGSRENIGTERF